MDSEGLEEILKQTTKYVKRERENGTWYFFVDADGKEYSQTVNILYLNSIKNIVWTPSLGECRYISFYRDNTMKLRCVINYMYGELRMYAEDLCDIQFYGEWGH